MKTYFYSASLYVNQDSGYTCRYNYSSTERFQLHYHDYYEIFLMISGNAVHLVNGRRQSLEKNSLIFVRPGDTHTYLSEKSFSFINLTFTRETIELLFQYLSEGFPSDVLLNSPMPPAVLLQEKEKDVLLSKLDRLNTLQWQNRGQQKLRMRILLVDIFTKYFSGQTEQTFSVPIWLENLCNEMNHPKMFSEGIEKMISLSGRSREHVARSMQKYYHMTLSQFINGLRLNYIANMLMNSDVPILDLCYDSGFQNVGWFYRVFKKEYGSSPAAFRAKFKAEAGK